MYLVRYEEHNGDFENLIIGETLGAAQYWVGIREGIDPFDHSIWEPDPLHPGSYLFILGDSQYVLEPMKSIR